MLPLPSDTIGSWKIAPPRTLHTRSARVSRSTTKMHDVASAARDSHCICQCCHLPMQVLSVPAGHIHPSFGNSLQGSVWVTYDQERCRHAANMLRTFGVSCSPSLLMFSPTPDSKTLTAFCNLCRSASGYKSAVVTDAPESSVDVADAPMLS